MQPFVPYHSAAFYFYICCREASQVLCLIFVDRIITAKVIERLIKKITYLSHFTVSYITGSNSSVDALAPCAAKETLESFREGKVSSVLSYVTSIFLRLKVHI